MQRSTMTTLFGQICAFLIAACATGRAIEQQPSATTTRSTSEVRGTWITTTANTAIATPTDTARTMQQLRDIGLNTVYVEVWKNGYTQFPSEVLRRTVGVDRRPALAPQDPSDKPDQLRQPGRDLLEETLIEAHRSGLNYIAWFEYGFMAAHKSTNTHLRRLKPEWLSRDITGNEVAPNGFVWINPLHPEARQFLLDLVLEAVDRYDLDGIQLDDRIVWPYITMGYDEVTKKIYAAEHKGAPPPADHTDAAWMRWRAEKVNEYAKLFVQEVRAKRPGLLISLSPAVYPWSWEHYLLEWPTWSAWTTADRNLATSRAAQSITPRWDEFIPQVYRFSYPAFEKTWREQQAHMKTLGGNRQQDLLAGIRVVGEGKDATWDELRQSIELVRTTGGGGHVLWFSRGVLDVYPQELKALYRGYVDSPKFAPGWRSAPIPLFRSAAANEGGGFSRGWYHPNLPRGNYRLIGYDGKSWRYINDRIIRGDNTVGVATTFYVDDQFREVELLIDRRDDMRREKK